MAKLYRKLEARAGNITFTRNIQGYVCWYSFLRAILREKMKNSNFEKNKNFFQSRKFRPKMTSRPRPHSKQQVFLLVLVFADGFLWSRDFLYFFASCEFASKKGKIFRLRRSHFWEGGSGGTGQSCQLPDLLPDIFGVKKPVTLFKKRYISKF